MTKIQIIIDEDNYIRVVNCAGVTIEHPNPNIMDTNPFGDTFKFEAHNAVLDTTPNLISMPDALLLRLRDYNIDTEHQYVIKETQELKAKIESLKNQVAGWEARRNVIQEEVEVYHQILLEIMEDHPKLAGEVAARLGFLDLAIELARRANEEE